MLAKQSTSTSLPPRINAAVIENPVNDAERKAILNLTSKETVWKLKDKKEFIIDIHRNHQCDILSAARLLDESGYTKTMLVDIENAFPKCTRDVKKEWNMNKVSEKIISMYNVMKDLVTCIKEQAHIHSNIRTSPNAPVGTSTSTSSTSSTISNSTPHTTTIINNNPVMEAFQKFEEKMRLIDTAVISNRVSGLSTKLSQIKLTPEQKARKWDKNLVPIAQTNLIKCISCGHPSVNYAKENEQMLEEYREKRELYRKDKADWDEWKRKSAAGDRTARKPPHLSRAPKEPTEAKPFIQCMCATSYCRSSNRTLYNPCPVKCCLNIMNGDTSVAEKDRQYYPFEGTPAVCQCDICRCKCQFACALKDANAFLLQMTDVPDVTEDGSPSRIAVQRVSSGLQIQQSFQAIAQNAFAVAAKEIQNDVQIQPGKNEVDIVASAQRAMGLFCEATATGITSSSKNISLAEQKRLQQLIGPPTTTCILPGGEFDTRSIMAGANHGTNNRWLLDQNNLHHIRKMEQC